MALFVREDGATKYADLIFKKDLEVIGFKLVEEETDASVKQELKKKPKTKK